MNAYLTGKYHGEEWMNMLAIHHSKWSFIRILRGWLLGKWLHKTENNSTGKCCTGSNTL